MGKKLFLIWLIPLFLLILGGAGYLAYTQLQQTALGDFTPIFCNDYEFTCCGLKEEGTVNTNLDDDILFTCDYTECKILTIERFNPLTYKSPASATCSKNWLGIYTCDPRTTVTSLPVTLQANEHIWVNQIYTFPMTYESYNDRLVFCGRSACDGAVTGVPIVGADKCTFVTAHNIYGEGGNLIREVESGSISYTVHRTECVLSWHSGDRHICGYLEESCDSDNDCGGHTHGNKECYARTLQTYGCRPYGTAPSEEDLDLGNLFGNTFDHGKRCEIIEARTVECCGDNDCGSNAFCDTYTFTCEETADCTIDADCGVSIKCDINTKELKKPICKLGKCDFKVLQTVQCCSDEDCASNYYCDSDYKCKESTIPKVDCPYECCPSPNSNDRELYFDKPCPVGQYCQEDNVCSSTPPPPPKPPYKTIIAVAVGLISALLIYLSLDPLFIQKKKDNYKRWIIAVISLIGGAVIGYFLFEFFWIIIGVVITIFVALLIIKFVIKK